MTEPHHRTSGHVELFRPGALTVWTFKIVVMAVVTDHFTVGFSHLFLFVGSQRLHQAKKFPGG